MNKILKSFLILSWVSSIFRISNEMRFDRYKFIQRPPVKLHKPLKFEHKSIAHVNAAISFWLKNSSSTPELCIKMFLFHF